MKQTLFSRQLVSPHSTQNDWKLAKCINFQLIFQLPLVVYSSCVDIDSIEQKMSVVVPTPTCQRIGKEEREVEEEKKNTDEARLTFS